MGMADFLLLFPVLAIIWVYCGGIAVVVWAITSDGRAVLKALWSKGRYRSFRRLIYLGPFAALALLVRMRSKRAADYSWKGPGR